MLVFSQVKISQYVATRDKEGMKFYHRVSIKKRRCMLIGVHNGVEAKIAKTTIIKLN
jgi:hypothetical protein